MRPCLVHVMLEWQLGLPADRWYPDNFLDLALRECGEFDVYTVPKIPQDSYFAGSIVICSEYRASKQEIDAAREKGMRVLLTTGDERYEFYEDVKPDGLLCFSTHCYNHFLNSGVDLFWFPFAVDPRFFRPYPTKKEYELVFVGGLGYPYRREILQRLSERGFRVGCFHLDRAPISELCRLMSSGKFCLNVNGSTQFGCNCRVFETPATKNLLLTEWNPDVPLFFDIGQEMYVWRGFDDLVAKVEFLLSHDELVSEVSEAGFARVQEYTYSRVVAHFCEQLGEMNYL